MDEKEGIIFTRVLDFSAYVELFKEDALLPFMNPDDYDLLKMFIKELTDKNNIIEYSQTNIYYSNFITLEDDKRDGYSCSCQIEFDYTHFVGSFDIDFLRRDCAAFTNFLMLDNIVISDFGHELKICIYNRKEGELYSISFDKTTKRMHNYERQKC